MTCRQRTELVEVRADHILSGEFTASEYALHFETQMHHSSLRRLLYNSYVHFAPAAARPYWALTLKTSGDPRLARASVTVNAYVSLFEY